MQEFIDGIIYTDTQDIKLAVCVECDSYDL
jgi:hypothetical protein